MKVKEIVGWLGVALILCAFTLTTFEILQPSSTLYGALNAFGALGIIISSLYKRDFQPVALNIVWLLIAVVGTIRSII